MFVFVKDCRHKHRFLASVPPEELPVKFSKPREIWERGKKTLFRLFPRVLSQELAFVKILETGRAQVRVGHSGLLPDKRLHLKFRFFLHRQRTRHVLLLFGETLLLPLSGLAMFLPGPNVFFGALALLIITHWQALKGINRLLHIACDFVPIPSLAEWEKAVDSHNIPDRAGILAKIEQELHLARIDKILS